MAAKIFDIVKENMCSVSVLYVYIQVFLGKDIQL